MNRSFLIAITIGVVALLGALLFLVLRSPPRRIPHAVDTDVPGAQTTPSIPALRPPPPAAPPTVTPAPVAVDPPPAPSHPATPEVAIENPDGTTRIVRDHSGEAPSPDINPSPISGETASLAQTAAASAVKKCAAALPPGVGTGGKVGVVAKVTATGGQVTMSDPAINTPGFADTAFVDCMKTAVSATTFAAPKQGDASYKIALTYPLPGR